ncbi:hypothetical protein [Schinkia azotoformans]|uniref:hypothetical protein n=1 Tax=Schinkia azotoformans TaxID=1454 RepID=UPI002DB87683|nr:hypothetical protein [Schinkia azotoformans]MEC1789519.1 hypothetical protein [Schinkia azotoformans]MED4419069.1 hypothetical protein [Schinkia azotoformans]
MEYLVQGRMVIDFSVKVEANDENEAMLIGEALTELTIKDCNVLVIGRQDITKLKVDDNFADDNLDNWHVELVEECEMI